MGSAAQRAAFEELRERLRAGTVPGKRERLASAILPLDEALGGGFPTGTLTTLEGPALGHWALAARLLAQATRRGLAAVIDSGALYPPDLAAAGVVLERLLVVSANAPLITARAADALLRSRTCSVIALDAPPLRSMLWTRLAALAHKSNVLLLVVTPQPSCELAAIAEMRLRCEHVKGEELHLRIRHESVRVRCVR